MRSRTKLAKSRLLAIKILEIIKDEECFGKYIPLQNISLTEWLNLIEKLELELEKVM